MKVRLAADVLDQSGAWDALDAIVSTIRQGRHRWAVDDTDAVLASGWFASEPDSRASRRNRETLDKAVTAWAYEAAPVEGGAVSRCHTREVTVGGVDGMSPQDACKALQEPAYLVVENATSDGYFVRAIVHAYQREELKEALDQRWLVLDHAGGKGEIRKRVRYLGGLAPGPRRVQVLADSDRLHPGHVSQTIKLMGKVTENHEDVAVHILHKREAENYLPLAALADNSRGRPLRSVNDAFAQLTPAQQDHYDMKHGFQTDGQKQPVLVPEQEALYAGVRPAVLRALVGGFGDKSSEWYGTGEPMPYHVTVDNFEARCRTNPGELAQILSRIEEMI